MPRHSPEQIQRFEEVFKNCPFPDEELQKKLSLELNLEFKQVKYWFGNRRMKQKKLVITPEGSATNPNLVTELPQAPVDPAAKGKKRKGVAGAASGDGEGSSAPQEKHLERIENFVVEIARDLRKAMRLQEAYLSAHHPQWYDEYRGKEGDDDIVAPRRG